MSYFVYMLKSIEKKSITYVGYTKDLDKRIRDAMSKILNNQDPDIFDLEEFDARDTGITLDDTIEDFLEMQPPKNKKKLH